MQDGSTIDLSQKTGEWSLASSLTNGANNKTKFVSGSTITINVGSRALKKGDKVISWTVGTKPDETVVFKAKSCSLETREDGLYVASVKKGLFIILR